MAQGDYGHGGYGPPGSQHAPPGPYQNVPGSPRNASPMNTMMNEPQSAYAQGPQVGPMDQQSKLWNILWFSAGMFVAFGSIWGLVYVLIFDFVLLAPMDFMETGFLSMFGLTMAVQDSPFLGQTDIVKEIRRELNKYIHLLSRLTGKGIVFIFLGTMLWGTLWTNNISPFFGLVMGVSVILVGLLTTYKGWKDSNKLNKIRLYFMEPQCGVSEVHRMYEKYAKLQPQKGLNLSEFNQLAEQAKGHRFEPGELKYVFNALASPPNRDHISREDLEEWSIHMPWMIFV